MSCRQCGSELDRPGDYCLVCRTANAETVVVECARDRATVTALLDEAIRGARTITTTPESGENEPIEVRNFAGLIADEIHRKRPEEIHIAGDRDVIRALRGHVHRPLFRVAADDPVEHVRSDRGDEGLAVVDRPPAAKIGGAHSTLIGDREGRAAVETAADHPHVKKVIPGPIETGGASGGQLRAKATRADRRGNVRLIVRQGSTVQENRVVTTADERSAGERIRADLNAALAEAGFGGE
ncbi:MAG: DUF2103 domain-containing protein [Halococcoides sp.]